MVRSVRTYAVMTFVSLFLIPSAAFSIDLNTSNIPGGMVRRAVEAPSAPGTMYAASWGVFKSTDFGRSWTSKPYPMPAKNADGSYDFSNFPRHNTYTLAVCPTDPDTVITGDQNETPIWRTTDGGATWTSVKLVNDTERRAVTMVSFSLSNADHCFAAGRINPNVNDVREQILFRSTDKGASWNATSLQVSRDQTIMDVIQIPSGRILAAVIDRYYAFIGDGNLATTGSIRYSTDNGTTFTTAATDFAPYAFAWDETNSWLWAVSSQGKIYKSTDNGATWTKVTELLQNASMPGPIYYNKILYKVCGGTPFLFATASFYGNSGIIYKSSDTGFSSWNRAAYTSEAGGTVTEVLDGLIYDVVVDSRDATGKSWGVATSNGGFYYSADNGAHVTQAPGINTREIRNGARQGERVFVNVFDNLIYGSTDNAKTWYQAYPPKGQAGSGGGRILITLHPTDPDKVYLSHNSIWVSTCNGQGTFQIAPIPSQYPTGAVTKQFTNILIHPSTPTVMFVGLATGNNSASGNYLFKSSDGGSTWSVVTSLTTHGVHLLAFDPSNPDIIYASCGSGWGSRPFNGTGDGLWKSTDGGATWTKLGDGTLDKGYLETIAIDPDDSNWIWTGGVYSDSGNGATDCIYVSTDAGKNWKTQLLNGNVINTYGIFYFKPYLYFGTSEGYLYKSDDRGRSWGVAMMLPSTIGWLIDDSTGTVGAPRFRAPSGDSLLAGSNAGLYQLTNIGPASGITGGFGTASGSTGSGNITDSGNNRAYTGGGVTIFTYPNPFNPRNGSATIRLGIAQNAERINVKIYSLSGDLVVDSDITSKTGGTYYGFTWNGRNANGEPCAPGIYFIVADVDGTKVKHKIVLVY